MMSQYGQALHQPTQLPTLVVSGDEHDVGYALGRHARDALRAALAKGLAPQTERWRGSRRVNEIFEAAARQFPDLCTELEGIARGANLPLEDVRLLNCTADLPAEYPAADTGCTTLMLPARRDGDERALIAHHEDAALTAPASWFIAHIARKGRPPFTSFCYAGRLPGNAFSINAAGLVQTINDVRLLEWKVAVPRGFLARAVLQYEDVPSAVALIESTPRASGYHHTIASVTDGRVVSIEAPSSHVIAKEVTAPAAHANHLIYEPLRSAKQHIVGGSLRRQYFAQDCLKEARLSPLTAMRRCAADGCTLVQSPSHENEWHQTIATAVYEIRPAGGVDWAVFGGDGRELVRGETAAPRIRAWP